MLVLALRCVARWSPQQIAAWLAQRYPDRAEMHVSHETIYQAIYVQSRGNLRAEPSRQVALRSGRSGRRPQSRAGGANRIGRGSWIGQLRISARPASHGAAKIQKRIGPRHHGVGDAAPVAIAEIILSSARDVDLVRLEVSAGGTWLAGYPSARWNDMQLAALARSIAERYPHAGTYVIDPPRTPAEPLQLCTGRPPGHSR